MPTETYLRALQKNKRDLTLSTVCSTCGTAYIANPALPNTETCGGETGRVLQDFQRQNWNRFEAFVAMNAIEHTLYLIKEREKRMSVEFDALKEHTAKLIQLCKDQQAEIATLKSTPAPAPDPAPADVAALDAEISALLPPA